MKPIPAWRQMGPDRPVRHKPTPRAAAWVAGHAQPIGAYAVERADDEIGRQERVDRWRGAAHEARELTWAMLLQWDQDQWTRRVRGLYSDALTVDELRQGWARDHALKTVEEWAMASEYQRWRHKVTREDGA